MEALLEREADVESWNDDRLDELSRRMDESAKETREEMRSGFNEMKGAMREGFDRLERTMSEGFAETNGRISETNGRIDRLMLTLLVSALGIIGALLGAAAL